MLADRRKTAILSVFDKTGLIKFARGLSELNIQLVASGGTARTLRDANIEVEDVSSITKAPEMLGGRVKTLHPAVHGGILAREVESDDKDLDKQGIAKIDFVICNLYPFTSTVAKANVTIADAIEDIDIGGVTLIRAAAKNHDRVTVASDPADYDDILQELGKGDISQSTRQRQALKAFTQTAVYDTAISDYFKKEYAQDHSSHLSLRYGINPHQKPAAAFTESGSLPFQILSGQPGYINLLDSLNAWALVKELEEATGLPAAASFKHVSPAGAAIGLPLSETEKQVFMVQDIAGIDKSALAQAYARARGGDRMSSFGDLIALSQEVDVVTAKLISREVSDGIIAPTYQSAALEILKNKKGGKYLVLQMDKTYSPDPLEVRKIYGVTLTQQRNTARIIQSESFSNIRVPKTSASVTEGALRDLTVATITLKYTQSNSVCYARNGQVIGLGAGQQSRIHCTRLAGDKADNWWMRFHQKALNLKWKDGVKRPDKSNAIDVLCSGLVPKLGVERDDFAKKFEEIPAPFTEEEREEWLKEIDKVVVSSDAFFPFADNIYRMARSGVKFVAAPSGSVNDQDVFSAAENAGITFIEQSTRLFHH